MTDRSTRLLVLVCVLAGAAPIAAVHLAYGLNLLAGLEGCQPYWDGCLSVSRAVRSGPGLGVFKALAPVVALAMTTVLWVWPRPPSTRAVAWLAVLGSACFVVYAFALGTDGSLYRWMRRYGVVGYFGAIGLAQLLLVRGLATGDIAWRRGGWRSLQVVLALTWGAGVLSALKRRLVDDPALLDRLENALEWWFALGLSVMFLALARVLAARARHVP